MLRRAQDELAASRTRAAAAESDASARRAAALKTRDQEKAAAVVGASVGTHACMHTVCII